MPNNWRTVRVFISSTFRDMHAERDHLVRFVFPELRELCAKRQLHLVDVDLRWGVTEDEARQGKALESCLDEIERCRPFFIGLLGERYGWIPPNYEVADEPQYQWLREFRDGHSVTALEIYQGVLRNQEMNARAFFYFRDPAFLSGVPEPLQKEFLPESPEAARKLRLLKDEIEQHCPVSKDYHCRYGGMGADGRVQLVELELFGQQVLNDLWLAITLEYPADEAPVDDLALERTYHDAFIEEHSRSFIGRDALLSELTAFADKADPTPTVITGTAGSGKSALLAKFANQYAASNPETFVLSHFIGVSPGSTDIRRTLLRLCRELKQRFGLTDDIPTDYYKLRQTFPALIEQAGSQAGIVLLIDALNQLDDGQSAHTLDWLPHSLPPGLRLMVSTLDGDCLSALRRRTLAPPEISVGPLVNEERKEIVRQTLWTYRKRLDERSDNDQIGALLSKRESDNPLYLRVACEEMRVFGAFERVTERIASLPDEVPALFEQMLARIEGDHGKELVGDLLALLACSRQGLLESELLQLLAPSGQERLPPAKWARLYRSLKFYLRPPGEDGEGALDFFHRQLAKAVRQRYFPNDESEIAAHRRLAAYFRQRIDPQNEGQWTAIYPRGLRDLPHHLLEGKLYTELFQLARDENFLRAQASTFPDDPDLQMKTLQEAITGAARLDDAPLMAEFMLTHARWLVAITQESPLNALQSGNLKLAWELAELHPIENRIPWLLLLAWELAQKEQVTEALATLERLPPQGLFKSDDRRHRDLALKLFAEVAICLVVEKAAISVEAIMAVEGRLFRSQGNLCSELCARHYFAAALEMAQGEQSALIAIAKAQSQAGETPAAEVTLGMALQARNNLKELADAVLAGDREAVSTALAACKEIAEAQAEVRDKASALATLGLALDAVLGIENVQTRGGYLVDIAKAQAGLDDLTAARTTLVLALETIGDLENGTARVSRLHDIAMAQVHAKDFAGALATVRLIDYSDRLNELSWIAAGQARAGDLTGALETVSLITTSKEKTSAMEFIARQQVDAKDFTGALKTISNLGFSKESERPFVLREIAVRQAQVGDFVAARSNLALALSAAEQHRARLSILMKIAASYAQMGDFESALEVLSDIKDKGWRVDALLNVADAQSQAGDGLAAQATLVDALQVARSIKRQTSQKNKLILVGAALARRKDGVGARATFALALATARSLKQTKEQASALASVAASQAAIGNAAASRSTLDIALEAARNIEITSNRGSVMAEIAAAKSEAGDSAGALEIIELIDFGADRSSALTEICAAQVRAGNFIKANEAAIKIETRKDRAISLAGIAIAQAAAGDIGTAGDTFSAALKATCGIRERNEKTRALAGITYLRPPLELLEGALDTVNDIENGWIREFLQIEISAAQARAGDIEGAIATVNDIKSSSLRVISLLAEIATAQARAGDRDGARSRFAYALKAAGELLHNYERASAMAQIATAQARAGEFSEAFETVRKLKSWDIGDHSSVLAKIAEVQAQSGNFAGALETSHSIDAVGYQAGILEEIARAQAQAGDRSAAYSTFVAALKALNSIESEESKVHALARMAATVAKAGFTEEAVHTAESILTDRDQCLPKVAAALVEAKDKEQFKRLLIPCAYYAEAAYRMCGLMARLYPEQADGIREEIAKTS